MSHTEISFSKEVKEELLKNIPMARHCRIAEIAVIVSCAGKVVNDTLVVRSDNERITQKYFTLLKKTFNIIADAFEEKGFFVVSVEKKEDVLTILQAVNILGSDSSYIYHKGIIASHIIKSGCCKRAFLKNAPILILDEATAFADPDNEAKVQQAFANLSKDKTVIMIAHRLSTVVDADKICVLSGGKIVESGTHESLIKEAGIYNHMWSEYNKSINWKVGKGA